MGYRSEVSIYAEFIDVVRVKKKLNIFRKDNELEEEMQVGDGWFNLDGVYWKMYANNVIDFFQELADIVDFTANIKGDEWADVWRIHGEKGKLYVENVNEKRTLVDGRHDDITEYLGEDDG